MAAQTNTLQKMVDRPNKRMPFMVRGFHDKHNLYVGSTSCLDDADLLYRLGRELVHFEPIWLCGFPVWSRRVFHR